MLVRDGGVIGSLSLMVWALVTGKVVPKWVYDDVAQQRDRALSVAEAMGNALRRIEQQARRMGVKRGEEVG